VCARVGGRGARHALVDFVNPAGLHQQQQQQHCSTKWGQHPVVACRDWVQPTSLAELGRHCLAFCALAAEMNPQGTRALVHGSATSSSNHCADGFAPCCALNLSASCLLSCCCAVGGVWVNAQTGSPQAAQLGLGAGALLGLSAIAMSDIRDSDLGELGVKAAWGESKPWWEKAG
jgi:hypothetical protein